MADVTITPANVIKGSGARPLNGTAGEALTAGQAVYLHTNGKLYLAHCETSALTAAVVGIALHAAAANQPVAYLAAGEVTIGGTLVAAGMYVLSAAGAICPVADLATDDWITYVGYAKTTAILVVNPIVTGFQKA